LHAGGGVRDALSALAAQQLFCAIAHYCAGFAGDAFPGVDELNAALTRSALRPCNVAGQPIRFVAADSSPLSYEVRVYRRGEVETRPDNWHDLFNALVWMTFPRTKAALNALHVAHVDDRTRGAGRGPVRDAATQFDESGIVVLSADAELLDLLMRRCWKTLFWDRRADVITRMRFLVFGHGLYDALRTPFYRMCGRAALIEAAIEIIAGDVAGQCAHADGVLAQRFASGAYPRPRTLMALPLLGIPGVTKESECPAYYEDREQFQPPPIGWDGAGPGGPGFGNGV